MQHSMWPLAALFVVGSLFQEVASTSLVAKSNSSAGFSLRHQAAAPSPAVDGAEDNEEQGETITPDSLISDAMQTGTPCSCDCCQVQKMLPMEFVPQPSGEKITSQCWKASSDMGAGTDANVDEGGICPAQCQLGSDNKILTSPKGQIDYNRFCNYNCQPVTDAVGTACIQFSSEHYRDASNSEGGNGKEVYPVPVMGLNSGYEGPSSGGTAKSAGPAAEAAPGEATAAAPAAAAPAETPAEKAKAEAAAKAAKLKIVYDMRKLISERLRSEAGAAVAAGAAAAERVRINEWTAKKKAGLLTKLRTRVSQTAGKVEEGVAGVEADTNAAADSERQTQVALADGRIFATKMVLEVRTLADEAIKKAVEPCSALAARNRAEAKGLDKPEDWVKVVSARAANPYQVAVRDAVMRTAEYKNLADGIMGQAYGAQKQANTLISHVNVLEAHGDVIGATIEKKQVTNLLSRAKSLQESARGYWKTADDTRKTIPKWQMAAAQAAAYSAWEYANNAKAFR